MAPPRPSSSSTNGNYQRYESKMSPHGQPLPGLIKSSPLSDESPSERLSQSNDKLCLIVLIQLGSRHYGVKASKSQGEV